MLFYKYLFLLLLAGFLVHCFRSWKEYQQDRAELDRRGRWLRAKQWNGYGECPPGEPFQEKEDPSKIL